jgi:hypothetical protein
MERVLARAAELQVARAGAEDGLSEADLLAAAGEAGLDPAHVRLALAEERLRTTAGGDAAERGFAAWVAGPGLVAAARVIAGPRTDAPDAALQAAALDAVGDWLEREEGMRLCRRTGDAGGAQAVWEPRRDFIGNVARGLRGGGSPTLRRAAQLRAAALPAGAGRVLVRVEADVRNARRQRLAAGAVAAGGGAAAGGSLVVLGAVAHVVVGAVAAVAAAPVLAGGAVAWALARGQRSAVDRTRVALERVLDAVETRLATGPALGPGVRPGGPAALLEALDGVRRALR